MWPNQMDLMLAEQHRLEMIAAAGRERAVREALGEQGTWAGSLGELARRAARRLGRP